MDKATLERIFAHNQAFLKARAPQLYGKKAIRFQLMSHYTGYEGMLKREIAYCKYEVWERVCECRTVVTGFAFESRIAHFPAGFSDFLIRRGYLRDQGGTYRLILPGFEGEAALTPLGEGAFAIKAAMRPRPSATQPAGTQPAATDQAANPAGPMEIPSLDAELARRLQEAAEDWTKGLPERLTDVAREEVNGMIRLIQGVWRRISQIDIDASGDPEPHAFRWQETELFARARFASLSEAECAAILKENGVEVPRESRLAGITQFDIDDKNACVSIRYEHVLPDPSAEPSPEILDARNAGLIVVENDFWEFHLDAIARKLIGENRKWRDVTSALSQAGKAAFTH